MNGKANDIAARLGVPASWAMERRMGGRKVRRAGLLNIHFPPPPALGKVC